MEGSHTEVEITVDGNVYSVLKYRRFLYNGKPFGVFIHPSECDEFGDPILYILAGSGESYTMPDERDLPALTSLAANLVNNETPFSSDLDVTWLPWE